MSGRLLDRLARRGIHVRRIGEGQIGVTGADGSLSHEAIAFIRLHKTAILAALDQATPAEGGSL